MPDTSLPPPPTEDPMIGQTINGKYRIRSVVAAGGMGVIFRAEQVPLGRDVALKVVRALPGTHPDDLAAFNARFLREASILANLQHPNIVTVFDYGTMEQPQEHVGRLFMAMEYLSGETLQARLKRTPRLPIASTMRIGIEICRGLRAAHHRGIVHRDLKPANVMLVPGLDGEELLKLVDFGIVKLLGDNAANGELTQEGTMVGSPYYMAPEQVGNLAVDERSDIYSLGVLLYRCLVGKLPYAGETSMQMILAHLSSAVIPFSEQAAGDVPDWLQNLVLHCLEKDPDKRPGTAEHVLRALQGGAAAANSGVLPLDDVTRPHPVAKRPVVPLNARRLPFAMVLVGAGGLVALAIFGAVFMARSPKPSGVSTKATHAIVEPGERAARVAPEGVPPTTTVVESERARGGKDQQTAEKGAPDASASVATGAGTPPGPAAPYTHSPPTGIKPAPTDSKPAAKGTPHPAASAAAQDLFILQGR